MKIITWNVRGASNNAFVSHAWDVVRFHNPSIFVIFETKAEERRARQVTKLLGFDDFKAMPPHGLKGGIWLMWKRNVKLVSWSEVSPYYFHSLFKFIPNKPEVLIMGMHAPATAKERHQMWRNMEQNLPPDQVPWMVVGDLNEVRSQGEKTGGRVFRSTQCKDLNSFMDALCLVDLGFDGNPFTWTNAREGTALIRERLDRALANHTWITQFSGTQKKRIHARLNGIQTSLSLRNSDFLVHLEKQLLLDLNNIHHVERRIWAQKAGFYWRNFGDYNTRYFHVLAKIKKSKGKIHALQDLDGNWVFDDLHLKNMARKAFMNIFSTKHSFSKRMHSFESHIHILHEDGLDLTKMFSKEEVEVIVKSMAPLKSPGPDGIQPIFYQKFWGILNDHLVCFLNDCFDKGVVPDSINRSYICLIPKKEAPTVINDFRPIGLCNTILKLLTNSIAARLRNIMPNLINHLQTSFILDRTIDENIIILKEVAHMFKKVKRGKNVMAIKIDLTKAFDSLEWAFIRETLLGFKFPVKLVNIIMSVITSPSISVLWNGEITNDFLPTRGIRQGDPLSPYIFVLCMERHSQLIHEKVNLNLWKPLKIAKDIGLSHLFYADDVFLFGKASRANLDVILGVLKDFGELSGLFLNASKSTIIVPRKMDHNVRHSISSHCNLRVSSDFGNYLGIQISPNKLRKSDYMGLMDKTKDRIRGWQAKLLNMAGRCTLIKSVLNTYPLYAMQTNIIPMSVLDELQKNTKRFLCNKVGQRHYISRTSWSQVCNPMKVGGLGIRDLRRWNTCFMAKLGWKFLTQPTKLWVQILKAKYCRGSNFLDAIPNQSQSSIWRDIFKGRELLNKGLVFNIGNGEDISLWYHHWVGDGPLYKHRDISIPDSKAHWRVARIIRNGTWYLDSIISLLPQDIVLEIKAIPLPKLAVVKDGLRWAFSKDGQFDIKSAYHSTENHVHSIWPVQNLWSKLWKIHAPFKYKMLLWNVVHGILPTAENLQLKIHHFDPQCQCCYNQIETHLHLFRLCFHASILWKHIFQFFNLAKQVDVVSFFNSDWYDWILFNFRQPKGWLEIFVIAIWHIWKNRNKAVFDGVMARSSTQYNHFFIDYLHNNDAFLKQNVTNQKVSQPTVWRPPVHGYLKLNTDGAWKSNNKASGGGVIRRTDGSWFMGFSTKFDAINPAAAELATIREGLSLAKDHNISRLEVETDAQALKIMMDRAEKLPHHQLSAIICDIVKLLKTNWVVVFLHAKRDANMVAHKLAKFGMDMERDKVTHTAPPQCVLQEYMQELVNPIAQ
ncbi:uncharacterized protein LOC125494124 [Beta vulgaris subsp. vulgaris]|uniref:uncharacterized protein LOC125494124 n=1 Tax=Beta vulgaris subsp. vulgaris TaxID=3555 RepID=UPI0020372065|nr:uncharacterized protein LOC125494124 [Beta vulgaris subsp. vulgaris]